MKLNLDLSGVNTLSSKTVVPTGNYSVQVVSAEPKEAKNKGNYYLELQYKILSGESEGVVLTDRLNIVNSSEDAQRIGLSTLKTILAVGGHKNPNKCNDTDEIVGLKLNIYIEEVDTTFEGRNGEEIETTENKFKSYYEFSDKEDKKPASKESKNRSSKSEKEDVPSKPPFDNSEDGQPKQEEASQFPWMK